MRLIIIRREKLRQLALLMALVVIILHLLNQLYMKSQTTFKMPLSDLILVIDPGHGGIDPGAIGASGVREDKINLQIAFILKEFIEESKGIALMTREDDKGLYSQGDAKVKNKKREDLHKRCQIINDSGAAFFISIHLNSFSESRYYGAQCFYQLGSEEGKRLAEAIQKSLRQVIKNDNHREAKSINTVFLLKNTKIPGVIVECGFLSNPQEERNLQDEEYQRQLAEAIFLGIEDYLK